MVVAATPTNSTVEAELTQASFDTNMIVILAALLCALICALGFNSIVRRVLRCTRSAGVQTTASATGLKKSTLRKIPIIVYGSELGSDMGPGSECPICLGEFVDGEKVRVLPKCNHGFHLRCIDTWLVSHTSCPNCRHSLVDIVSSSKAAPPHSVGVSGGGRGLVLVEVNTQS